MKKVKAVCDKGKAVSVKLDKEKKIELSIRNKKVTPDACVRLDMTDVRNNTFRQYAAISTGMEDYMSLFTRRGDTCWQIRLVGLLIKCWMLVAIA